MTNLEYLQNVEGEVFAKHLADNIDKFCEQVYSTKEDEQGLIVTKLNKEKFVAWLKSAF